MKKILLSLVLVLSLFATYFGMPSHFVNADQRKFEIVALGDSITTGYGLDGYDANTVSTNTTIRNYVNLVAENKQANIINLAHDGDKAENLLQVINNTANDKALSNADCILITIGGNELLQPLIDVAQQEVVNIMLYGIRHLANILESNADTFNMAIEQYKNTLPSVIDVLLTKNSSAQIIFQTQYNPLENAKNSTFLQSFSKEENYEDIDAVYNVFDTYITKLNTQTQNIISSYNNSNLVICDTYKAYKNYAKTNVDILTNIDSSIDIHPNSKGHEFIYTNVKNLVRDNPVVRKVSSTIYIYTNGTLVNDPTKQTEQAIGGSVEDAVIDENGYTIFQIYENDSKILKIIEQSGYKLSDVKLDGKTIGAKKDVALKGSDMPATIEIYFLEQFSVTFSVGFNGSILVDNENLSDPSLNIIKTILYQNSISCNIQSNTGYEIDEIKVNDEKLENTNISSYTIEKITKNTTFSVSFKKIEKTEYTNPTYNIKLSASTDSILYGTMLNVQTISAGEKYNKILK